MSVLTYIHAHAQVYKLAIGGKNTIFKLFINALGIYSLDFVHLM